MRQLKPGARLRSAVCSTEIIVIKAPSNPLELSCGGAAMLEPPGPPDAGAAPAPGADGSTAMGKRYVNADSSLEVLCTRAGAGSLFADRAPLGFRESRALPSSD